jgi:hypothetical protein
MNEIHKLAGLADYAITTLADNIRNIFAQAYPFQGSVWTDTPTVTRLPNHAIDVSGNLFLFNDKTRYSYSVVIPESADDEIKFTLHRHDAGVPVGFNPVQGTLSEDELLKAYTQLANTDLAPHSKVFYLGYGEMRAKCPHCQTISEVLPSDRTPDNNYLVTCESCDSKFFAIDK